MTTSNSYDFTVTRDDIIKHAYEEIGVLEESETPNNEQIVDAAAKLNILVKSWIVKGHHLWALQDCVLFQVLSQQSYSLGNSASDANWCAWDDYAQTTLSAAGAAGAASVSLTSATGFATNDKFGVVLDDGTIQWTTCTISGTTATLGAVLTGAAASGNVVFGYTSRIYRPMRIVKDTIFRRDINNNDTPIQLIGPAEYELLTAKTQAGKTIQAAYQPFLGSGRLWTWPTADLSTDVIRFTIERPLQDFDLSTDNPDLPIEWSLALYLNLAVLLARSNGASDELATLKPDAAEALDDVLNWDRDNASVKFQPDIRRYGRSSTSRRW